MVKTKIKKFKSLKKFKKTFKIIKIKNTPVLQRPKDYLSFFQTFLSFKMKFGFKYVFFKYPKKLRILILCDKRKLDFLKLSE